MSPRARGRATMAPLLLALLAGVTALLLVGAEGSPPGALPVGAGGPQLGTPGFQHPPGGEEGLYLSDDDIMSGEGPPSGFLRCSICKWVAKRLRHVVVNPKDKAGVANITHRLCGRLVVGKGLCRDLLSRALAPIEAALKRHETPTHLCAHLNWCPPQH